MNPRSKSGSAAAAKGTSTDLPELVAALESSSPVVREKARASLVAVGKRAVPTLVQLLSHRKAHVRWEAAKALGTIADPIAASALVKALKDRDGDVRWLAAEGLAALGEDALQPLLAALIEQNEGDWLCEGAHHVFHSLSARRQIAQILRPLLAALSASEPKAAAPLAAYTALSQWHDLSRDAATSVAAKRRK